MADGQTQHPTETGAGYASELLRQWRPLVAATLGLASGFSFSPYIATIMAPHLIQQFDWSRAQFASVGGLLLVGVICFPIAGRLADLIGVRRTALIGTIALPSSYVALSTLSGDLKQYALIWVVQICLGTTAAAAVYSRVVVQYVKSARGLAFAITGSGPALSGAIAGPLLNNFVEAHGWRSGYLLAAGITLIAGAKALLLLPSSKSSSDQTTRKQATLAWADYRELFSNKSFWLLAGGIFSCSLPHVISTSQLKVMLLEHSISARDASVMIMALASGTLLGRFICGFALDRFPSNIVAAISMSLPAIGLAVFALHFDAFTSLTLAVFLIGLSIGAENDILGYIIAKEFGTRTYSSVFGVMMAVLVSASSFGAVLLGYTLSITDSFTLFLWISVAMVLIGGVMFLSLTLKRPSENPVIHPCDPESLSTN